MTLTDTQYEAVYQAYRAWETDEGEPLSVRGWRPPFMFGSADDLAVLSDPKNSYLEYNAREGMYRLTSVAGYFLAKQYVILRRMDAGEVPRNTFDGNGWRWTTEETLDYRDVDELLRTGMVVARADASGVYLERRQS